MDRPKVYLVLGLSFPASEPFAALPLPNKACDLGDRGGEGGPRRLATYTCGLVRVGLDKEGEGEGDGADIGLGGR